MDKTPNLGLNRYTFKDLADARKLTEDNDKIDLEVSAKVSQFLLEEELNKKISINTSNIITPTDTQSLDDFPAGAVRANGIFEKSPVGSKVLNGEVITLNYPDYKTQKVKIFSGTSPLSQEYSRDYGADKWSDWRNTFNSGNLRIENGIWKPSIAGNANTTSNEETYFIFNNECTVRFGITINSITDTGIVYFKLPIPAAKSLQGGSVYLRNIKLPDNTVSVVFLPLADGTGRIDFSKSDGGHGSIVGSNISAGAIVVVEKTYQI